MDAMHVRNPNARAAAVAIVRPIECGPAHLVPSDLPPLLERGSDLVKPEIDRRHAKGGARIYSSRQISVSLVHLECSLP